MFFRQEFPLNTGAIVVFQSARDTNYREYWKRDNCGVVGGSDLRSISARLGILFSLFPLLSYYQCLRASKLSEVNWRLGVGGNAISLTINLPPYFISSSVCEWARNGLIKIIVSHTVGTYTEMKDDVFKSKINMILLQIRFCK